MSVARNRKFYWPCLALLFFAIFTFLQRPLDLEAASDPTEAASDYLQRRDTQTSCAFVANNPSLTISYADEIDEHDREIRFNDFWLKKCFSHPSVESPCEERWGWRTTDVVLNDHRESRIEDLRHFPWQNCYIREYQTRTPPHRCCYSTEDILELIPNCTSFTKELWDEVTHHIIAEAYDGTNGTGGVTNDS